MPEYELLSGRMDIQDAKIENARVHAESQRHELANQIMVNTLAFQREMYQRLGMLEISAATTPVKSESGWMKWVLGAQGALIAFFAYLVFGHAK